jgi:hypothetical protein
MIVPAAIDLIDGVFAAIMIKQLRMGFVPQTVNQLVEGTMHTMDFICIDDQLHIIQHVGCLSQFYVYDLFLRKTSRWSPLFQGYWYATHMLAGVFVPQNIRLIIWIQFGI